MIYIKILGIIASIFMSQSLLARDILYDAKVQSVSIQENRSTLFRFDYDVKTISQADNFKIGPADTEDANYSLLSITPLNSRGGNLVFILSNDDIVNLNMEIVSKTTDHFFDFKSNKNYLSTSDRLRPGSSVSDMDLMKAMIKGANVDGYKSKSVRQNFESGNDNISIKLVHVYIGSQYNGYIFKLTNEIDQPYRIDLKKIRIGSPNLAILANVDDKVLFKEKSSTLLRIVAKSSSDYRSIVLPVSNDT